MNVTAYEVLSHPARTISWPAQKSGRLSFAQGIVPRAGMAAVSSRPLDSINTGKEPILSMQCHYHVLQQPSGQHALRAEMVQF